MSGKTIAAAATAALVLAAAAAPLAATADDVFVCPDDFVESCTGVPDALAAGGFDSENAEQLETNAVQFGAGAEGDVTADVTFSFVQDRGLFEFTFGLCLAEDVPEDLLDAVRGGTATVEQRREFATNCLIDNGRSIFDDTLRDAGDMSAVTNVPVPSTPIFFLIPDKRLAEFAADPEAFYASEDLREPLFSLADANPGYFDQLVMYRNDTNTLFLWEDLERTGESDLDFNDLVFDLNVALQPEIPSGCTCDNYEIAADGATSATVSSTDGNCACLAFDC